MYGQRKTTRIATESQRSRRKNCQNNQPKSRFFLFFVEPLLGDLCGSAAIFLSLSDEDFAPALGALKEKLTIYTKM
jgi:hypothetical protein